jgi:hypothetical protein
LSQLELAYKPKYTKGRLVGIEEQKEKDSELLLTFSKEKREKRDIMGIK